jgi:hypothetical protein
VKPGPNIIEFERLVRAYLAGEVPWDTVHKYAIEMEWAGATDFPHQLRQPLEALHAAFVTADERDDPQFRLERSEISKLVDDLDQAQARHGST